MNIKRLTKDELAEGLTVELVNSIDMTRSFSPVQIAKDDEPVKLLKCLNGYNVLYDDNKVLKDSSNKAIVINERTCQVGRARYLLKYAEREKESKTTELIASWKAEVRVFLDRLKGNIKSLEFVAFDTLIQSFDSEYIEKKETKLKELKALYEKAEEMFAQNKIAELIHYFGIAKLNNLMLSVEYTDATGMQILKNVFGAKALDTWDGDILNRYARIEIEKQYSHLKL